MKKITTAVLLSSLAISASAADLKTEESKMSYAIGVQMAESLAPLKGVVNVDRKVTIEALNTVLDGKKPQLSNQEFVDAMTAIQKKIAAAAEKKYKALIAKNTKESEKLLVDNKSKKGVKVTKSGLQYRVIKQGKGAKPVLTDKVKVHYKGTFANGKVFDSSYERGQPVIFPLNGVIKGWSEGVQLMPVGSTYELVIPANLAYGDKAPANIGPARALTFQVELLGIEKDKK